jgi:K+-transporting ATPase ATPase C chain
VEKKGAVVGSALVGQDFAGDRYFHPRPSVIKYDASSSGASNWGYTSKSLKEAYAQRKADWEKANGGAEPPMDMLFASGSGLDPHISPLAAEQQVARVAAGRGIPQDKVADLQALVRRFEETPQLGFLGEPRVNVLALNLALDKEFPVAAKAGH